MTALTPSRPPVVVLRVVSDVWSDDWDVTEERDTGHGWLVYLGYPSGAPRGRGCGGKRIIVTPELAAYLERHRQQPKNIRLPFGRTAIKRLRRLLGHQWAADVWHYWCDHMDDLLAMTLSACAAKHRVSEATACHYRTLFFGRTIRPADWWRDPDILALLESDLPRSVVADRLDLSVGSVGRLRWVARGIAAGRNRTGTGQLKEPQDG